MFRITPARRLITITIIMAALAIGTAGCSASQTAGDAKNGEPAVQTYFIFDTIVSLRVYDEGMTPHNFEEAGELLERIDRRMNRHREGSDIARVNAAAGTNAAVAVTEETFHVVEKAIAYAELTGGHFDPTVGPLVDLWGIGTDHAAVPGDQDLSEQMGKVDYLGVNLDETSFSIQLREEGMSLDLGAIAKGYAADVIANYLREQDFGSAIIDLGGNILAMGAKPDGSPWIIGIQDPEQRRGKPLGSLEAVDQTIVTSGIYERFFESDGRAYHHILSPFTGYPVDNELLSVTIVTSRSIDADALSTSVFSLGLDEGRRFVERRDDAEAIFVTKDRQIYLTEGLVGSFKLTNSEYRLAH